MRFKTLNCWGTHAKDGIKNNQKIFHCPRTAAHYFCKLGGSSVNESSTRRVSCLSLISPHDRSHIVSVVYILKFLIRRRASCVLSEPAYHYQKPKKWRLLNLHCAIRISFYVSSYQHRARSLYVVWHFHTILTLWFALFLCARIFGAAPNFAPLELAFCNHYSRIYEAFALLLYSFWCVFVGSQLRGKSEIANKIYFYLSTFSVSPWRTYATGSTLTSSQLHKAVWRRGDDARRSNSEPHNVLAGLRAGLKLSGFYL